jgi:uncharacterized protein YndB with AHSA1/START domain
MNMRKAVTDQTIRFSVAIQATPQVFWSLLADDNHRARWWGSHVAVETVQGGLFRETWNNGEREVVTAGKIIEVEPPRHLSMTWADDDWPSFTTLQLDISAHPPGGSRLELTHRGWEIHAFPARRQLIADHAAGWERHLRSLASYAESHSSLEQKVIPALKNMGG